MSLETYLNNDQSLEVGIDEAGSSLIVFLILKYNYYN